MEADKKSNSDSGAKRTLKQMLEQMFPDSTIETNRREADVILTRNNGTWYFEIKKTSKTDIFGAATLTEWEAAFKHPDRYYFVLMKELQDKSGFRYNFYTPAQFKEISTIPPFKINFNLHLDDSDAMEEDAAQNTIKSIIKDTDSEPICSDNASLNAKDRASIKFSEEFFDRMKECYQELKNNGKQ